MTSTTQTKRTTYQLPWLQTVRLSRAVGLILVVSAAAFAFLCWIIYLKHPMGSESGVIKILPAMNAGFNALSTLFLIAGFAQIRKRNFVRHMQLMFAAFVSSTLFLVCYIIYHNVHGDTHFIATGAVRPLYFFILTSHITLSAVALPLILTSFYLPLS